MHVLFSGGHFEYGVSASFTAKTTDKFLTNHSEQFNEKIPRYGTERQGYEIWLNYQNQKICLNLACEQTIFLKWRAKRGILEYGNFIMEHSVR